ncbi:MAG: universal stress protein [Geminicoccaceae bacterium]|nr:universal stress protein [Geminicoccaceae bacterium]
MKTILVAVDGSEHASKAVDVAGKLARLYDARLHLLHVVPFEPLPEGLVAFARAEKIPIEEEVGRWQSARLLGDALVREAAERLRGQGLEGVETHVEEGSPGPVILAVAERLEADLIVVGSRGRTGLAATLLGSVSHRVALNARCSVLIVR